MTSAHQIKKPVDEDFPEAEKITLVLDNLNTHATASPCKAFEPEEARRTARKLELVYPPKHGSWLDMAEIEFSVFSRTGLPERVPAIERLSREAAAWQERRNQSCKGVVWRFATEDARVKLASLYPKLVA